MVLWAIATLLVTLLALGGETARLPLEERVRALENGKIPIHFKVQKGNSGKKHVLLYTNPGGNPTNLEELLPLDLSAFIRHGMAEDGDELETSFHQEEDETREGSWTYSMTAFIGRKSEFEGDALHEFTIHLAGGIGFVRLSEASKTGRERVVSNP